MKHKNDYIDNLQEWQENQFNPGRYAGNGKTPPYISAEGNPGLAAISWLLTGLFSFATGLIVLIWVIIQFKTCAVPISVFAYILLFWAIAAFSLMGYRNLLRKKKAQRMISYKNAMAHKKRKKGTLLKADCIKHTTGVAAVASCMAETIMFLAIVPPSRRIAGPVNSFAQIHFLPFGGQQLTGNEIRLVRAGCVQMFHAHVALCAPDSGCHMTQPSADQHERVPVREDSNDPCSPPSRLRRSITLFSADLEPMRIGKTHLY